MTLLSSKTQVPSNGAKTGKLGHEIALRILWSVLFGLPFAVLISLTFFDSRDWVDYLYYPAVGLWLGFPEGVLRRSWKLGLIGAASIICTLWVTTLILDLNKVGLGGIIVLPIIAFSVAGLLAGLGAKSLLSSILGMISGSVGFYAVAYTLDWLDSIGLFPSGDEAAAAACVVGFSLLMPVFFGGAVWAGLKFSRTQGNCKNLDA